MWAPLHNENVLHTNVTPFQVQFLLYATLLLIGWKWKLVKRVYLLHNFFGFSSELRGSIFQSFAWKTKVDWQIIMRLMMISRFLRKPTSSRKNCLKQIGIERRKISHKWKEFRRATRKQRTSKLIVATLLYTYGNSATRALLLTLA